MADATTHLALSDPDRRALAWLAYTLIGDNGLGDGEQHRRTDA